MVSLVFGLAAPLCFTAPVMLAVPLFGAAIALVALRRISASQGALAGRWAASAGLALCVASLLAFVSHSQVKQWLQVHQAQEFGRNWLALLQTGDTEQAFRLTVQGAQPPPASDEPGASKTNPYEDFLANPVIKQLTAVGAEGQFRLDETLSYEGRVGTACIIQQRFSLAKSAEPGTTGAVSPPVTVDLRLQRARLHRELLPRWLVISYSSASASAGIDHAHDDGHVH